jgi:hypothetical protein
MVMMMSDLEAISATFEQIFAPFDFKTILNFSFSFYG